MDISYGSFNFKTSGIPVPRVTINYQPQDTSAGRQLSSVVDISLKGQVYGTGEIAVVKASGMAAEFAHDYRPLRIMCNTEQVFPPPGTRQTDIDNSIYIKSANFSNSSDSTMYYVVDFDLTLSANIRDTQHYLHEMETDGPVFLRSISDNWSIQEVKDESTYLVSNNEEDYYPSGGPPGNTYYNITRTVSAEGFRNNDNDPFQNARKGVALLLKKAPGIFHPDNDVTKAIPSNNQFRIFNHGKDYSADTIAGSLTYTENYIAFTGNMSPVNNYTHSFEINNTLDQEYNRTVTINGTIKGFDREGDVFAKTSNNADVLVHDIVSQSSDDEFVTFGDANLAYGNANKGLKKEIPHLYPKVLKTIGMPSGDWVTKHDADAVYDDFKLDIESLGHDPKTKRIKWLNPIPTTFNADHDVTNGEITYSCTYDNRVFNMIPGAIVEELSVRDEFATTGYATQNVMYRGAVPQHIGTLGTPSRTVSYNATFPSLINGSEIENQVVLTEDSYLVKELANAMAVFDPRFIDDAQINNEAPEQISISSWITEDSFEINFVEGTLSKNMTWNYTLWR